MQVADIIPEFAAAFPFPEFNDLQRTVLPAILETDENVVVSAPTASGKTALAELAICTTLQADGTVLYIAPLRALTNEKEREWERFESLGYSVYVVTGERDLDPARAARADVLVMTPEKVDIATRSPRSQRYGFITRVMTCVVDEIHLLDSDTRGSVIEVTLARLRRICDPRIIALSATMPNADDIATWIDAPDTTTFAFDESHRPVPLNADVATYEPGENTFADEYRRLYRALDLIEPHLRDDGQGLIFVSSRRGAVQAAQKTRDVLRKRGIDAGARGEFSFHTETQPLHNDTLRDIVLDGVAFHHAGLSRNDKTLIEQWYRAGYIRVLCSTSTLAWGVNLPARCVVIQDTTIHDPLEGEITISPLEVSQMLGRAGRPGFDDVGYGWVITEPANAPRFRRILAGDNPIESQLASDLTHHLLAEIARGTVTTTTTALEWIETTYYAVRAHRRTGTPNLQRLIHDALDDLVTDGLITVTSQDLEATPLGRLASSYYLDLETAVDFQDLITQPDLTDHDILLAVARAAEFRRVRARRPERDAIDTVLGPTNNHLDPGTRKVLAILTAGMNDTIPDELASDAWAIRRNAQRLLAALAAISDEAGSPRRTNHVRVLEARLTHGITDDAVGLTAIPGIGTSRASRLADAGIRTPEAIRNAGVAGLETRGVPTAAAERILEHVESLPAIDIDWRDFPERLDHGTKHLYEVAVRTTAGRARVGIQVTVNGHEMTRKESVLNSELTVPIAVYAVDDPLEYTVTVVFPGLPLPPVRQTRRIRIA